MTFDGSSNHYYYDAENRLIQVNGTLGTCSSATACYTYDAEGRRVEKVAGSQTSDYVYDNQNRVIAEFNPTTWTKGYVYLNGQLLAQYSQGTTYFMTKDHLGSTRIVSAVNQSVADSFDYYPYGALIAGGTTTTHTFTADENDAESSLFHTEFRQYSPLQARWTTLDPADLAAVDPINPQSWNRYTYVLNHPLTSIDARGLDECYPDEIYCDPCVIDPLLCAPPPPVGGGGGAPVSPPVGTPIPEAPTDVGDDPGFGNGPIWTEQIPISSGPFSPWLIIENWTTTQSGSVVGDFSGERLCLSTPVGGCVFVFWDPNTQSWENKPPQTIQDQRASDLAQAINKTGVQSLGNPCTVATWYGLSAALGTVGGAAVGGEVLTSGLAFAEENWLEGLMWLNKAGQRGTLPGWLYFVGRAVKAAPQTCQTLQNF